jgi:hypothetical protein
MFLGLRAFSAHPHSDNVLPPSMKTLKDNLPATKLIKQQIKDL